MECRNRHRSWAQRASRFTAGPSARREVPVRLRRRGCEIKVPPVPCKGLRGAEGVKRYLSEHFRSGLYTQTDEGHERGSAPLTLRFKGDKESSAAENCEIQWQGQLRDQTSSLELLKFSEAGRNCRWAVGLG